MARHVSLSQFRSQLQQIASRQKRAIDDHNRAVRKHNENVRQVHEKRRQAINTYNQGVRAHNARVHANRARLRQALSRLQSQAKTVRYERFHGSVQSLHVTFTRLEQRYAEPQTPAREALLDLSEQETANSLDVMNALLADNEGADGGDTVPGILCESTISTDLALVSPDLDSRWRGALYALHPKNPDAARHFCTSAREIVDGILNARAPADAVVREAPSCDRTHQGTPTRRARIHFLLHQRGMPEPEAESFVSEDVENVVTLFEVFNAGTHGRPGCFALHQLLAVKRRVEDCIGFLIGMTR